MTRLPTGILGAAPFRAFLADLSAIGMRRVTQGGTRYVVIAARSNPRWWLTPVDDRQAAVAGLEMLQPVTRTARIAKAAARVLAKFGLLQALGRGQLRLSGLPEPASAFGGRAVHSAFFTGTEGVHRKTTLQLMDSSGVILGYAKLSRAPHVRRFIRNEARILVVLSNMGLDSVDIPKVLSIRDDSAMTLLVTDSLKSSAHSAPLQPGPLHLRFLEELRGKTSKMGAGATLERLSRQWKGLENVAGPIWTARLRRALQLLEPAAEAIEVGLAHGDFTPWNSFLQAGRLYVFDWEYANAAWPVGFDLTHYMLATTAPEQQLGRVSELLEILAREHFRGDMTAAGRAFLLSLLCHVTLYLGRIAEAGGSLSSWSSGAARGAMIDSILNDREATW